MAVNQTMRNNLKFDEFDLKLKEYAKEHKTPIILDDGLMFLNQIIKINNVKNILEIGAAIGYSAIEMAKRNDVYIDTIERDLDLYNIATENIRLANLEDRIKIHNIDALDGFDIFKDKKYDLIFIDAAKAQYQKFFTIYEALLNPKGIIMCDNMNFHKLIYEDQSTLSRSVRGLVRKLQAFEDFLLTNDNYISAIYDIGDGMSLSIRKD